MTVQAKAIRKNGTTNKNAKTDKPADILLKDAEYKQVATDKIDVSPLNYRKFFSEEGLTQFAQELKQHGVISPLTLRPLSKGRYELVAGERRLRAAKIAGLPTVPAAIATLTDEQVIEIQLAENLQRENPHPMHEAQAIGQMQRTGKNIEEIAARLGKPKPFVYSRIKLLSLIEPFQEMVLADVITIQDALQIAALSETSQTEFFEERCASWKKQKKFQLHNLDYYLNHYRYDLKTAPFNTKDKKLVPEVGACSGCASNSATLKSLFPEMAKEAICSNKECYNNKCRVHFMVALTEVIDTYQPVGLIYDSRLTEFAEGVIALVPGAIVLPRHDYNEISVIRKPEEPDKEDYTYENDEEENELDTDEYNAAVEQYQSELEAYNLHLGSGHYQVGIMLDRTSFQPVHFNLEKPRPQRNGQQGVTAKEVQAAIKDGTVTSELLQGEIGRLQQRETRLEELDKEKVQLEVHDKFFEQVMKLDNNKSLTSSDMAGARLIIYQSLDYHTRQHIQETLLTNKKTGKEADDSLQDLYKSLGKLTEQEFSYLIRVALCSKSESKYPFQQAGYFLYQMAKEAELDVQAIENAQAAKRRERQKKQKERITELEAKIKRLAVTSKG